MTSIGYLPFAADIGVDGSALFQIRSFKRTRFLSLKVPPWKCIEGTVSSGTFCPCGHLERTGCGRLVGARSRAHQLRGPKYLRATSKDFVGPAEDADQKEDIYQATIEKSKKVLTLQRHLLQQISERKKLISSIRESIANPEDIVVPEDGDGKLSNLANDSLRGNDLENINISMPSRNTSGPAEEFLKIPVASPNRIPDEYGPEHVKTVPSERAPNSVISNNQLKQSYAEAVELEPDTVPPILPVSTELPTHKEENYGSIHRSNSDEANKSYMYENEKPPPLAGDNVMNVIMVAAECAPFIKTGGLGDVAGSLPKALARRGHRVMVVVPRYNNYADAQESGIRKMYKVAGQDMEVTYFHAYKDGVDFVFIDSPIFRHIENNIYGGDRMEILKRMALFCKAAVEVQWHVPCGGVCYGDGNLVFIANDWHTALLPVYLKAYYRDNGLMMYTRSILVIHNIAHQGRGPVDNFSSLDLPQHYLDLFKLYDPVGGEHLNIFAAGLKTADRVITVSHGYAWEVKTSEGGWGLHGIMNENDWKLSGIVNGIDTTDWNPEVDIHLTSDGYTNYSLDTLREGKRQCKAALQRELGLHIREDVPLIGFIGRLDPQKGVDLIAEAIPWMMGQDVQLVMLGTGRQDLEQMLRQFESQYRDKIRGWVGFCVKTSHRITAGADILLMPSRFEPCGLNQLYAMKYGTIPVVHAVGGLKDTVQPFDPFNESGLGWTFDSADANKLIDALGNCLLTYRQYKQSWEGLQMRGMQQDLSWDNAANKYEEVLVTAKYQW